MPVLPLVASITVWPGLSAPLFSAASMIPTASRSLTEPIGFIASTFTYSSTSFGPSRRTRTTGVRPTVWMMSSYRAMVAAGYQHHLGGREERLSEERVYERRHTGSAQ